MTFQLIAGNPALDLVNTLDWRFGTRGPQDLLTCYGDVLRFAQQSKLLTSAHIRRLGRCGGAASAAQVLESCRELREAMADIFYAQLDGRRSSAAARTALERYFQAAHGALTLNWTQSPRVQWDWDRQAKNAEAPIWALALSAEDLMTSEAVFRVRSCDNPECRWLFLDGSKNHTRRWCDMKLCGNRIKARKFKARQKSSEVPGNSSKA